MVHQPAILCSCECMAMQHPLSSFLHSLFFLLFPLPSFHSLSTTFFTLLLPFLTFSQGHRRTSRFHFSLLSGSHGMSETSHVTLEKLLWCQCKAACDESKLSCDIHSLDNLCGHCSNHIENILLPLPPHYSQGIILVYDITMENSFDNITRWLNMVEVWEYTHSTQIHNLFLHGLWLSSS